MRHVIERHKIKLLIGFPIVVLVASTLGFASSGNVLKFKPENRYIAQNATTSIDLIVRTEEPINVVGGVVVIPPETSLEAVSLDQSVVDLWTTEPIINQNQTSIPFAGGIIRPDGFTGEGVLFSFTLRANDIGEAEILLTRAEVKAHDGAGSEVLEGELPMVLLIREPSKPNPDLNRDNRVGISDIGILSTKLFGSYRSRYDINADGRVTVQDIFSLFRQISII